MHDKRVLEEVYVRPSIVETSRERKVSGFHVSTRTETVQPRGVYSTSSAGCSVLSHDETAIAMFEGQQSSSVLVVVLE